jgi:predicted HicB family RNase H-like nuclease
MKTKSIKLSADTHKAVKIYAAQQGIPLGEAVERLLTQALKGGAK